MLIHSMDCDEGPGAHLICQEGEPKGTWEDSWKALESLVDKGKVGFATSLVKENSPLQPLLPTILNLIVKRHNSSVWQLKLC